MDFVCRPLNESVTAAMGIYYDGWQYPTKWLNHAEEIFITRETPAEDFLDLPFLIVKVATPGYLLAMKIVSSRQGSFDFDDTRFLVGKLGIGTREEAEALVRKYFPRFRFRDDCVRNLENAFRKASSDR
ncbi:MAG: hypothetical protein LBG06_11675 [Deltaproteobacteria bacterium]|nr:hypothetical protein [Deltaproteobacteria bacterium]